MRAGTEVGRRQVIERGTPDDGAADGWVVRDYVSSAKTSGRWMLVRERADEQDDEVVCRGREMTATIDEILAAIVDELQCLAEEIQCSNSSQD